MTRNVGTIDRILRAALGVFLLWLAFGSGMTTGWVASVAALVGIVMLVVAAVRICPIYTILGVRTCSTAV